MGSDGITHRSVHQKPPFPVATAGPTRAVGRPASRRIWCKWVRGTLSQHLLRSRKKKKNGNFLFLGGGPFNQPRPAFGTGVHVPTAFALPLRYLRGRTWRMSIEQILIGERQMWEVACLPLERRINTKLGSPSSPPPLVSPTFAIHQDENEDIGNSHC